MKKIAAATLLGGASVGSLLGAGTASASTSSFLSAVHGVGWYSNQNGDASLAHNGSLVCQWLDSGRSEWSVTNTVYQNTGYDVSWADAQEFMGIAQSHLC